jgi:hypothetical protein
VVETSRKFQKLVGVFGWRDSGVQDRIVTGAFTFLTQPFRGYPNQWVKPVEGPDNLGAELH